PDIIAPAMTHKPDLSRELLQGIGELQFPGTTRGNTAQNIKNIRGEHIPSYRTKIRRCIIRSRLFDDGIDIVYPFSYFSAADYSIVFYLLPPDLLHNNNRAPVLGKRIDHLAGAGGKTLVRYGDRIAQEYRKRLIITML